MAATRGTAVSVALARRAGWGGGVALGLFGVPRRSAGALQIPAGLGDRAGVLSQHRSRGFLLRQPSPRVITLPFQSRPAGTGLFSAVLKAAVVWLSGAVQRDVLRPKRAGVAEPLWKARVIRGSCSFVTQVWLLVSRALVADVIVRDLRLVRGGRSPAPGLVPGEGAVF